MLRFLALLAFLFTLDAAAARPAANWVPLRSNAAAALSIDKASIRRRGDQVSFRYLVDFAQPQGDFKTAIYRSLITAATVRCKPRMIALGASRAFAGPAGRGPEVGIAPPTKEEARFRRLEAGSSDEELWSFVCGKSPPHRD